MKKTKNRGKRVLALLLALSLAGTTVVTPVSVNAADTPNATQTKQQAQEKETVYADISLSGECNRLEERDLVNQCPEDRETDCDGAGNTAVPKFHVAEGETAQSGNITEGALEDGVAYELPETLLYYNYVGNPTRQYACPERNGVYFILSMELFFLDLADGSYEKVFDFGGYFDCDFYCDGKVVYWVEGSNLRKYSLTEQKELPSLVLEDLVTSVGVGLDKSGRVYVYGKRSQDEERSLMLYSAEGKYLDSFSTEGPIYSFVGFRSDGSFVCVGYRNWLYWGYEHDMDALMVGAVQDNKFVAERFGIVENLGQRGYSQHQDYASMLTEDLVADYMGNIMDFSKLADKKVTGKLSVKHQPDEELPSRGDLSSVGTRMVYNESDHTVTAYASANNLNKYDLETNELVQKYVTQHFVFSLLDYGDRLIAIERENNVFYIEMINKSSFKGQEVTVLNLNERDIYATHTMRAVARKYKEAEIPDNLTIYQNAYTLSPYKEAELTQETKDALLKYSNYMRWLGGLTPFESSSDDIWTEEAKGALILTKLNDLTHEPEKPADMDDAYYESAKNACSNSNLYGAGVSEGYSGNLMDFVVGWLDDTANASTYALGHRYEFLQRAGNKISYGMTNRYMAQRIEVYGNQINATGNVQGVDNNDYCYTWPGAGYFPTSHINTKALWSICLNKSLIDRSSKPMQVQIEDLTTGKVTDVTETLGSSAYMGSSIGYFKGMFFHFAPPADTDYTGKSYKVTVSNLELANGDPAVIEYTVNFFNVEDAAQSLNGNERGDLNGDDKVDLLDLRIMLRSICKKITLSETQEECADLNEDGSVDLLDLRKLLRYICKKIDKL